MEDIYTFGEKRYEPAVPLEISIVNKVRNAFIVLATIIKCSVVGVWILAKSFVLMLIPTPSKSIRNQVAMVRGVNKDSFEKLKSSLVSFAGDRRSEWYWPCHLYWIGQMRMQHCCGRRRSRGCHNLSRKNAVARCQGLRLSGEVKSQRSFQMEIRSIRFQCDVANYDEVRTLREKIRIDLGSVDIVVNNAGLLTNISLLEGGPEDVMRVLKVNLVSQFWVMHLHPAIGSHSYFASFPLCRRYAYSCRKWWPMVVAILCRLHRCWHSNRPLVAFAIRPRNSVFGDWWTDSTSSSDTINWIWMWRLCFRASLTHGRST